MREWACRRNLFTCALGLALLSHLVFVLPAVAERRATETEMQQNSPPPAVDPHGAVLCVWFIYLELKILGDRCFSDDASEFPGLLNEAIEQIDKFIIENGPATRAELETAKAALRKRRPMTCSADNKNGQRQMYEHMRNTANRDVSAFRAELAKLLAVPRKPVMTPCL